MNTTKIRGKKPPAWSEAELSALVAHYQSGGSTAVLPLVPGRSIRAIQNQAHLMKLSAPKDSHWTAQEDAVLRENYAAKGGSVVGAMLGRTVLSVRRRAQVLGVRGSMVHTRRAEKPAGEPKHRHPNKRSLTVKPAKPNKPAPQPLQGEARITSATRVTIAPAFVDRRFVPTGAVPRVVDSAECREWARAAA